MNILFAGLAVTILTACGSDNKMQFEPGPQPGLSSQSVFADPLPSPVPTPEIVQPSTPTCANGNSPNNASLLTLVQSANSPANSSDGKSMAGATCGATLAGFVATANGGSGAFQKQNKIQSKIQSLTSVPPVIGVNCTTGGSQQELGIFKFEANGLRGNGITSTDICAAETALPCTPSSSGFLFSIEWDDAGGVSSLNLQDGTIVSAGDLACGGGTRLASPLVIEDRTGAGIKTLDPQSTQTEFDLTGDGTRDRISCVTDGAFLALPDDSGRVQNINQLFGNNTVGPDGFKAANGFLALGKYDANGDGVIDAQDPVFHRLRLWHDYNCDGIAQTDELTPLTAFGIVSIRWAHATPMQQIDVWGNDTEERSLVDLRSGSSRRIFDLWFKISP